MGGMRRFGLGAVVLCAMGCGASAKQIRGADGFPNWWISCKTSGHVHCLEVAGQKCPYGWYLLDEQTGMIAAPDAKPHNSMLIRCKAPQAEPAPTSLAPTSGPLLPLPPDYDPGTGIAR